jgi:hypothetical protein
MRIWITVVTYNDTETLNANISSLLDCDLMKQDLHIEIINNHSNFYLYDNLTKAVNEIHHNTLRPDFSTGHLARDWNSAIVRAFKDLDAPDYDLLILAQDDLLFKGDFFEKIQPHLEKYDIITSGEGDAMVAIQPEGIKNVGLFDERFSLIDHHEADFFLRCVMYHKMRTSLNDYGHHRIWQPCDNGLKMSYKDIMENKTIRSFSDFIIVPPFSDNRLEAIKSRLFISEMGTRLWKHKWGETPSQGWTTEWIKDLRPIISVSDYMMYPYFENKVRRTYV